MISDVMINTKLHTGFLKTKRELQNNCITAIFYSQYRFEINQHTTSGSSFDASSIFPALIWTNINECSNRFGGTFEPWWILISSITRWRKNAYFNLYLHLQQLKRKTFACINFKKKKLYNVQTKKWINTSNAYTLQVLKIKVVCPLQDFSLIKYTTSCYKNCILGKVSLQGEH